MLKTNLMNAAKSAGINGLELAHFMAQIEHESNGFQLTATNACRWTRFPMRVNPPDAEDSSKS